MFHDRLLDTNSSKDGALFAAGSSSTAGRSLPGVVEEYDDDSRFCNMNQKPICHRASDTIDMRLAQAQPRILEKQLANINSPPMPRSIEGRGHDREQLLTKWLDHSADEMLDGQSQMFPSVFESLLRKGDQTNNPSADRKTLPTSAAGFLMTNYFDTILRSPLVEWILHKRPSSAPGEPQTSSFDILRRFAEVASQDKQQWLMKNFNFGRPSASNSGMFNDNKAPSRRPLHEYIQLCDFLWEPGYWGQLLQSASSTSATAEPSVMKTDFNLANVLAEDEEVKPDWLVQQTKHSDWLKYVPGVRDGESAASSSDGFEFISEDTLNDLQDKALLDQDRLMDDGDESIVTIEATKDGNLRELDEIEKPVADLLGEIEDLNVEDVDDIAQGRIESTSEKSCLDPSGAVMSEICLCDRLASPGDFLRMWGISSLIAMETKSEEEVKTTVEVNASSFQPPISGPLKNNWLLDEVDSSDGLVEPPKRFKQSDWLADSTKQSDWLMYVPGLSRSLEKSDDAALKSDWLSEQTKQSDWLKYVPCYFQQEKKTEKSDWLTEQTNQSDWLKYVPTGCKWLKSSTQNRQFHVDSVTPPFHHSTNISWLAQSSGLSFSTIESLASQVVAKQRAPSDASLPIPAMSDAERNLWLRSSTSSNRVNEYDQFQLPKLTLCEEWPRTKAVSSIQILANQNRHEISINEQKTSETSSHSILPEVAADATEGFYDNTKWILCDDLWAPGRSTYRGDSGDSATWLRSSCFQQFDEANFQEADLVGESSASATNTLVTSSPSSIVQTIDTQCDKEITGYHWSILDKVAEPEKIREIVEISTIINEAEEDAVEEMMAEFREFEKVKESDNSIWLM